MFKLFAIFLLTLLIPSTIIFNRQQHNFREHASTILSTPTPSVCKSISCLCPANNPACSCFVCPSGTPSMTPVPTPGCYYQYRECPNYCIANNNQIHCPPCPPPVLICPSGTPNPTASPSGASLSLTLFLHGIGSGGDNANPNAQGNTNPLHPKRNVLVSVYDLTNTLVSTLQGVATYVANSGNFQGIIDTGNIPNGQYILRVHTDGFLNRLIPSVMTITNSQTTVVPPLYMINGDVDNDNRLDILDYNTIISCFGSKAMSSSCVNKNSADLNDDGKVDGIDYNVFLRELSVQNGDGVPIPSGTPIPTPISQMSTVPTKDCTPQGSCRNGQACPTGTVCSFIPVYGCYPVGCPYPICLASNTKITTPQGDILVTNLKKGTIVWSLDKQGNKIAEPVLQVTSTTVPSTHMVVHLVLSDGRQVYASKGHPTADGRTVDQLRKGDTLDGAIISSTELVSYWDTKTYDVLPAGETGYYFANGIPLGSTLKE